MPRKSVPRATASVALPAGIAPDFFSPIKTARILRVGLNQLYRAIGRGEIRAVRLGGQYRVSGDEIARLKRGETAAQ